MWKSLAKFVVKNRIILLILLTIATAVMGYFASQVKLSYDFSKSIPSNNPKYLEYKAFQQKFGDDGNVFVLGVQSPKFFELKNFQAYQNMLTGLKSVKGVEDILSLPGAIELQKDSVEEKLNAAKIFPDEIGDQATLDSARARFENLPFYRDRLYNPATGAYMMAVRVNKQILASKERTDVVNAVKTATDKYTAATGNTVHLSGLPLIRTVVANMVQSEMKMFLLISLGLSTLILLLFFRSLTTTLLSLAVVIISVIWTVAVIYLMGYQITLLTALIPSLVVVIGIPNCIYFLNKYHSTYEKTRDKEQSIIDMVSKMGIVTLFCNIAAAIGFFVFAFTKSDILKEFGWVAGVSIMLIFVISFVLLPAALSLLPPPKERELKYLHSRWISNLLERIINWVFRHKGAVLGVTAAILAFAVAGMMRLKSVGYIVDDLPKSDVVYQDMKFFENNFNGVMPLEILIDTKKRRGLTGMRALTAYAKVDSLAQFIAAQPEMNHPLSVAEALKFAKQGFYEGDSASYAMPNEFDGAFVAPYLRQKKDSSGGGNALAKSMNSFIDTAAQVTRISVNMKDVGTEKLPGLLARIDSKAKEIFDSSYNVSLTGTSITFLEGSRYIINGLKESILWAFLLIAVCMLYLFKSLRILLCSLIPNVVPIIITAGVMGWAGVPLKPSTVLVFSVALGIAVDITIRFLVNYRQVMPESSSVAEAVEKTIRSTGLSIIYTSLVLIAGFIIFCASKFGGTFALGWLTSLTLLTATLTNLVLLPVLLLLFNRKK